MDGLKPSRPRQTIVLTLPFSLPQNLPPDTQALALVYADQAVKHAVRMSPAQLGIGTSTQLGMK
jgi:hypothetical protein